jgi:double-strand break repair protein AddB
MTDDAPHLYHLPPGADFATDLVLGLQDRLAGRPPEAMAKVTLFLNSQRMRRRVTQVMTARGATFLPAMRVVSDLGDDPALSDLPPQVPDLRRRLELAALVKGLLRVQPELAPMAARFDLAESLGDLLAEMQDEAVTATALADLDVSGHSAHWARTQAFLRIIAPYCLDTDDAPSRQRIAVQRLIGHWQEQPPQHPVIIAGSTGSRGTTAALMQAIAGLAQGAVVVPGFDALMPDLVWQGMDDAMTAEDHPQYRYRRLMEALGVGPEAFRLWRDVAVDQDRNRLVSLALRPAPVTDQWLIEGADLPDLTQTTAALTLVEAATPREEAATIAVALRRAVEGRQRAALITPDRALTRRVSAVLAGWGLVADDSAGSPLGLSATGRLLRHVGRAFGRKVTADALLVMIKHPLAGSGSGRGLYLRYARLLELELRRNGPAFPTAADLDRWAARVDPDAQAWAQSLGRVLDLFAAPDVANLTDHVARHIAAVEALARGGAAEGAGNLWLEAAGQEAWRLIAQLRDEAPFGDEMSALEYQNLFDGLIRKGEIRQPNAGHPLIAFYGPREAREMVADVVILGGLTDGIWPAAADPDPWLNRKMRRDAGLLLPERQIGLAAHDFQQAIAARVVILTRSTRDAEAETVPSRWLNRLCNLMEGLPDKNGPAALAAMRQRGREVLGWARALDRPTVAQRADPRLAPAPRPRPKPPLSARPKRLSLTQIATLIRDPYAIYAPHVLNLRPLDPLRHEPENRDRGTLVHLILERFVKERPTGETPEGARARLIGTAVDVLRDGTPYPSARILWLARLERATSHLLRQDGKFGGIPVLVEEKGSLAVGSTGFTLIGTPDRIDMLPDGRLHLIDYKTGSPPTKPQQEAYEKQLLLAAVMAEHGGFKGLGAVEVARITYIGLGSGDKAVETDLTPALLDEVWLRFTRLIVRYGSLETGYSARRAVFESRYALDYDHLSRFGEWQMSDLARDILVGPTDGD